MSTYACPRCSRSDAPRLRRISVTVSPLSYVEVVACDRCVADLRQHADPMVVVIEEQAA